MWDPYVSPVFLLPSAFSLSFPSPTELTRGAQQLPPIPRGRVTRSGSRTSANAERPAEHLRGGSRSLIGGGAHLAGALTAFPCPHRLPLTHQGRSSRQGIPTAAALTRPKGGGVGAYPRWQSNHRPFLRERKEKTEVRREKI